jgi:DUF4097 and DUF4098 domain-containing protein YvlB
MLGFLLLGAAAAMAGVQQQTDTSFAVPARVELRLESHAGSVLVRSSEDARVRVRVSHDGSTRVRIRQQNQVVRVDAASSRGQPRDLRWELFVPRNIRVRIEGVELSATIQDVAADVAVGTVSGNIDVNTAVNVDLNTVQGEINVSSASGRVVATSMNDDVRITGSSGEVKVEAVNGSVTVARSTAVRVEASTINGRVEFDGQLQAGGAYTLSSHNGDVTIALPAGTNASVTASTHQGGIESEVPLQMRGNLTGRGTVSFTVGNGGPRVELSSFSGTIFIRRNPPRI